MRSGAMGWGCALCLALAGGALLALLALLLRWLRADGDLTLLWAERWGKKPGNAGSPASEPRWCRGRERGAPQRGWWGALGCWCHQLSRGYPSIYPKSLI